LIRADDAAIVFESEPRDVGEARVLTSTWFDRLAGTVFFSCESLDHWLGCLQIRVPDFLAGVGDELFVNKEKPSPSERRVVQQALAVRRAIHRLFIERVASKQLSGRTHRSRLYHSRREGRKHSKSYCVHRHHALLGFVAEFSCASHRKGGKSGAQYGCCQLLVAAPPAPSVMPILDIAAILR
jgi:hypothetical protein